MSFALQITLIYFIAGGSVAANMAADNTLQDQIKTIDPDANEEEIKMFWWFFIITTMMFWPYVLFVGFKK